MLWIVVDSNNQWLYYGRGSCDEAIEAAQNATKYDPDAMLYAFTINTEVVIEPERID